MIKRVLTPNSLVSKIDSNLAINLQIQFQKRMRTLVHKTVNQLKPPSQYDCNTAAEDWSGSTFLEHWM
ncbi:MAG: hypothetical protein CMN54_07365 [SAR324 cluster bacterium]|uniref:Uncharacterized protein n=1 Tax=SAR324 cluster bacterium TaxID=2024889 RepID=A0A2D6YJ68_9DELT|nr:hypothetical protein [SAR324 cluster bacterium]